MDYETTKINRQVNFMFAQVFDPEDSTGKNNTWIYNRAPDGYKFVLVSVVASTDFQSTRNTGIVAVYDGHEYTHWNQYPGVESRELLSRFEFNTYQINNETALHEWECKEFTIGVRSSSISKAFKVVVFVWYYLRKMTSDETKMYAVMQPKSEHYRKGGPTTLTEGEETV